MLNTAQQSIKHDMYISQLITHKDYAKYRIRAFRGTGKIVTRMNSLDMMNITLHSLEQYREERALEFSLLVDSLLTKVRQELKLTLEESLTHIPQLAAKLLSGKASRSSEDLISTASQHRLLALSPYLQQELAKYLDRPVKEGFVMLSGRISMPTGRDLQPISREYRLTLSLTEVMSKAMNKAYQEALKACLPASMVTFAEKLNVGDYCLNMVACHPERQKARCLRDTEKAMRGMVKSYFLHLEHHITSTFAHRAYQLYDELQGDSGAWKNEKILRRHALIRTQPLLPAV